MLQVFVTLLEYIQLSSATKNLFLQLPRPGQQSQHNQIRFRDREAGTVLKSADFTSSAGLEPRERPYQAPGLPHLQFKSISKPFQR